MRLRIPLIPMAEVVAVLGLVGLGVACLVVQDAYSRYVNGPTSFGAPDMQIDGNRLLDQDGRHFADWVPPEGEKPGRWKINEKYASELHLPREPGPVKSMPVQ